MTPEEKRLVEVTFAQIQPIAREAAALFYGRLFEIAPAFRHLFKHDMDAQGMKLMQTIGVAVAHLDHLDEVVPAVRKLGQRHVHYGVKPEDYAVVGEALLWTLEQGLGAAFTPAVKDAWATVYGVLASTMQEAAYSLAVAV
ncbi:MAG: hypothetical protein KC418_06380 [Anaerolineales bacterium]|nr:hypothetical protein [Anaerolineales bacterium]